jgi:cation diffusion facilitator family transporter
VPTVDQIEPNPKSNQKLHNEKIKVAVISIIASAALTILKLAVGFSSNSLGILSEAFHSSLDVIAAVMTFYAIRMAMRPRDLRYTYGYAKHESLTSLTEIILLFIVAGWVFYEGINRIFFESVYPEITIFSIGIMVVSIIVDFWRSGALYRVAKKSKSQALEADALHFKADMLTSTIVLIGLLIVFFFKIPNADAYAAIVVAGMIIYTSLGLGRRTLDVLLDKAPKGVYTQIIRSVSDLEGVSRAYDVRIRQVGPQTFIDLHIEVPRTYTHSKAHDVATSVEEKIRKTVPSCDVLVHVDAIEGKNETIMDRVRLVAAETEGIKNIHSTYLSSSVEKDESKNKDMHLYLDVQMDNNLEFRKAHELIDKFESQVKQKIPEIKNITTHIETEVDENIPVGTEKPADKSILETIRNSALSIETVKECKDIGMISVNDELHITLTIKISTSENLTVDDAHKIATNVQNLIIKHVGASRVIVHTEPTE